MNEPSKKPPRITTINGLSALVASNEANNTRNHRQYVPQTSNNNYSTQVENKTKNGKSTTPKPLLECLQPEPLLTSKPFEKPTSQRRRKNKPFDPENLDRSNDDQVNKPEISTGKIEIGRSTIDIRQPTNEHLLALKSAFQQILVERSLSDNSLKQREFVFTKLRELITSIRPDCQVSLYGSMYFECCLEKPGIMDIDIQFKDTLQYDTLKELYEIIQKSELYKEAKIDPEHKPSCIHLITNEPNMRVKLTSGYIRGVNLSKLIRIYTKFDSRVIKLLRLIRILAKTCNTDQPEIGTLHPVVFHIMTIHFLQQLDQPVLPCLHEYAYGIDLVPITLNENQYPEFLNVCKKYSSEWKSKNTTNIEMLFLQFLSYYVKTFNTKQFVVSIQTRMPVMKVDKNWHSRKLLVEDPTDVKRSLCQTMQSMRSIDYFRATLNAALNYFARKQKKIPKIISNQSSIGNTDDDLIEIVNEDDTPANEPKNSLHNSYKLFYKRLPPTIARDANIKQGRVREYYKQTFDNKYNILPKGIIRLKSSNDKFDRFDENDIQEAFQHDLEQDFEVTDENDDPQNENHAHLLQPMEINDDEEELNEQLQQINIEQKETPTEELSSVNDDEQKSVENDASPPINDIEQGTNNMHDTKNNNNGDGNVINIDELMRNLNKKQRRSLQREYQRQGNVINDKVQELHESFITSSTTDEISINDKQLSTESDPSETDTTKSSPSSPIPIKTNDINPDNEHIPSPFLSSIKLEQIIDNDQSTTENSSEFFYNFQPENFHAEQGAPYVCTTCNGVGHLKNECPELILPKMVDLPEITEKWFEILSLVCRQITDRCKPTNNDTEKRKQILNQLEKQIQKDYPECNLHAFGSFYNGFGFRQSDLDVCIVFKDEREQNNDEVIRIMQRILRAMKNSNTFENVQPVLHAKVPIIRSRHRQLHIEIDISLHNMLAIENTRLLKTYTEIDPRVSELGYMIKNLAKFCGIGDASRGTLSSYAYIIMLIHFLQQTQPPVLPVLQQLNDPEKKNSMYKKCSKWNVYFYDDLSKLKEIWKNENKLSTGALWVDLLRFYTEQFNYEEHIVTIRQIEPLLKHEKGWFRQTIAIEDPFELSHNLAGGLSLRNWTIIRRVFISARQQFGIQIKNIDLSKLDILTIEETLFNIDDLCPTNAPKRCEWCKGPYHIRKRCPKLATLAYEKDKKQRTVNNSDQQYHTDNHSRDGAYYYSNKNGQYYYNNNVNGYTQPKSAPPNQHAWEFYNSTEQQVNNSSRSYQQRYSRPQGCFSCGEPGHIKIHCPLLQKNNSNHHQKTSS